MHTKFNFSLFILSLIPLGYILKGALPVDLTLILYCFLYLSVIYKLIIKKEGISFSKTDVLFYLWALVLVVGIFYSPVQIEGLVKVSKFILLALSLIIFTRVFVRSMEDINKVIHYLLINSALTGYLVLLDFVISGMDTFRYQAFGNVVPIPLSMLGATALLISIFMFYYKKINFLTFMFTAFPSISVMTIAASKGPVLSLIITLALMCPFFIKKIKIGHILFTSLAIFALTRIQFVKDSLDTLVRRFERAEYDMSTSIRIDSYEEANRAFQDSPLFGIGTAGNYPDYPHNFFLEVLSENGILLFLVIVSLLVLLMYQYIITIFKKVNNHSEVIILSLIIISLTSLMFSFSYVDHKYLFLSIGLLIIHKKMYSRPQEDEIILEQPQKKNKRFKRYKIVW